MVPDLSTALRRVEDHGLPLESDRAQVVYGTPSAINRLLILNAEPHPGRGIVLLLREAIGFSSQSASRVGSWGVAGVARGHCQRHSR